MLALINGRIGRRRYWSYLAAILLVGLALGAVARAPAGLFAACLWLWIAAPRLHDLGRSGWWAVGVVVFIGGAIRAAAMVGALMVPPMAYLGMLLQFALVLWLGAAEGETAPNRFGPPPAARAARAAVA